MEPKKKLKNLNIILLLAEPELMDLMDVYDPWVRSDSSFDDADYGQNPTDVRRDLKKQFLEEEHLTSLNDGDNNSYDIGTVYFTQFLHI